MIRVQIGDRRRRYLRETLDVGSPDQLVYDVLSVQSDRLLVPVRHAIALEGWLDRCHAYFGLGYPTTLIELRASVTERLIRLDGHPAMWGHGLLGQPRSLPISCWEIAEAAPPQRLYALQPLGREGYLLPTKERVGERRGIITAWSFTACDHGPPRDERTMFRSSFATHQENPVDPATQDAARENVRAALIEAARADREAEPALGEDAEEVRPPT